MGRKKTIICYCDEEGQIFFSDEKEAAIGTYLVCYVDGKREVGLTTRAGEIRKRYVPGVTKEQSIYERTSYIEEFRKLVAKKFKKRRGKCKDTKKK